MVLFSILGDGDNVLIKQDPGTHYRFTAHRKGLVRPNKLIFTGISSGHINNDRTLNENVLKTTRPRGNVYGDDACMGFI